MSVAKAALVLAIICPLAFPACVAAQVAPQTLTVSLSDYAFAPGHVALKAGEAVTLHLVNAAAKAHSFAAPEFFAASMLAAGDVSKVRDGVIELDGGQSADVTVTPLKPGTYSLRCTHFLHASMGMTGSITVQ